MSNPLSAVPTGGKIGDNEDQARNRTHQHYSQSAIGNGTTTFFPLQKTPSNASQIMVYVAGLRQTASALGVANDYTVTGSTITFTVPPGNNVPITFDFVSS